MKKKQPALLYSIRDLVDTLSMSRAAILVQVKEGTFPKPVRVGVRGVRWKKRDVDSWLAALPESHGREGFSQPTAKEPEQKSAIIKNHLTKGDHNMGKTATQVKEDHAELIAEVIERGEELGVTVTSYSLGLTISLNLGSGLCVAKDVAVDPHEVELSEFLSLDDVIKVLGLLEKGSKAKTK